MPTRFILAGGMDRTTPSYRGELKKAVNRRGMLQILSCFFSQPEKNWEEWHEGFNSFFNNVFSGNKRYLARLETFEQQAKTADLIYLHGGDTDLLKRQLNKFPQIDNLFEKKIVVGSSAGANFLSNYYWTPDGRAVYSGSGLTPLNIIVHFGSGYRSDDLKGPIDWKTAQAELQKAIGPNQKITRLAEGKVVVFET